MSLSAMLFGEDSFVHKITNIMGLGIPGMLHKWATPDSETEPTRLGEISQQTAKEAIPRPIVWGRVRPIGPNITHSQMPVKRLVMSYVESGGKGGGKKKEKTYREHVFKTYALGVCEGPITAFSRIWRNNKLVYDGRQGSEWGATNNHVFLASFRLYLGRWDQLPDPTLESIWGVGKVPAYRGTAYIVALDEDLTDQGGMVPQWLFEVERAEGTYLTSKPYAVQDGENLSTSHNLAGALIRDVIKESQGDETVGTQSGSVEFLSLRDSLYDLNAEPEQLGTIGGSVEFLALSNLPEAKSEERLQAVGGSVQRIQFSDTINTYPEERLQSVGGSVQGLYINES